MDSVKVLPHVTSGQCESVTARRREVSVPCPLGKGPEQPLGRGSALPRLGAELELRRSGSSLGPSQPRPLRAPPAAQAPAAEAGQSHTRATEDPHSGPTLRCPWKLSQSLARSRCSMKSLLND